MRFSQKLGLECVRMNNEKQKNKARMLKAQRTVIDAEWEDGSVFLYWNKAHLISHFGPWFSKAKIIARQKKLRAKKK